MQIRTMQRREKKYLIAKPLASLLRNSVQAALRSDSHNSCKGYKVRTLYFDTIYDEDYYDQLESIENRRKIRLRLYPPEYSRAMLEIKEKSGAEQCKRSLGMEYKDARLLLEGRYSVLLNYDNALATEMYLTMTTECYIPKCIVEYDRMAYFDATDGVRITFDSNVCASESNLSPFDEKVHFSPVLRPGDVVLEVKYKTLLLSYIREMLGEYCKLESSVSKYSLSRQYL